MYDLESSSVAPRAAAIEDPVAEKEWQDFQTRRDRLTQRLQELETELRNMSELPATRAYAAAKDELTKRLPGLLGYYWYLQVVEAWMRAWIALRRSADAGDRRAAAEIRQSRQLDQEYLARLRQLKDMPPFIIADAPRLLARCLGPIAELETELASRVEQTTRAQEDVGKVSGQLVDLTRQYRAYKHAGKEEARRTADALARLATDLRAWGARDPARLACFLRHAPERRREIIAAYRHAHPGERCPVEDERQSGALPPTPQRRPAAHIRERRPSATDVPAFPPLSGNGEADSWRFVFTDEARHDSPLPDDWKTRRKELRFLLASNKLTHANPSHILAALERVTQLTVQQRQELHKLAAIEPEGWKVARAGRFRLFLDIDEQNRSMRFLVRARREAYRKRHHCS